MKWLAVFAVLLPLIAIPMASADTVLMLEETWGIGKGEMQDQLQGALCPGNTQKCVEVDYPASLFSEPLGVVALNTAIDTTPGDWKMKLPLP